MVYVALGVQKDPILDVGELWQQMQARWLGQEARISLHMQTCEPEVEWG